jgi:hypothetical protein
MKEHEIPLAISRRLRKLEETLALETDGKIQPKAGLIGDLWSDIKALEDLKQKEPQK